MDKFKQSKNRDEEIGTVLGSIMTAKEYSQIKHETPYVFKLKVRDKKFHYFGSRHSRNPEDPLFSEIEQTFIRANPDIVFIEGISTLVDIEKFNKEVRKAPREEIIDHMGETDFTLKLAVENEPNATDYVGPILWV